MRLVEHGGGRIAGGSIELTDRAGRKHNLVRSTPGELRAMRGADMAMIFQEPMTSLNPVFNHGKPQTAPQTRRPPDQKRKWCGF